MECVTMCLVKWAAESITLYITNHRKKNPKKRELEEDEDEDGTWDDQIDTIKTVILLLLFFFGDF